MEDGDVVVTVASAARNPGSGTAVVGGSRHAAPGGNAQASTSSATLNTAIPALTRNEDVQSAGSSSASDRRAAIVELMREHGDAVLGFCIRALNDSEVAEDVRQQTFLEAFRDFDRFQGRSSRRAWLFGIASHRCLDALRRHQLRSRWLENNEEAVINTHDAGPGPIRHIEHTQLTSALEDCLKLLSPEARTTVLLRFQSELSYDELARQLSTNADALQMRVTRALSRLRRCLENKGVYND